MLIVFTAGNGLTVSHNAGSRTVSYVVKLRSGGGLVFGGEDGQSLSLRNCTAGQVLKVNANGNWVCGNDEDSSAYSKLSSTTIQLATNFDYSSSYGNWINVTPMTHTVATSGIYSINLKCTVLDYAFDPTQTDALGTAFRIRLGTSTIVANTYIDTAHSVRVATHVASWTGNISAANRKIQLQVNRMADTNNDRYIYAEATDHVGGRGCYMTIQQGSISNT